MELGLGKVQVEKKRRLGRQFPGPGHDKLLGVGVEILIADGRRIQGVEQLADITQFKLDLGPDGGSLCGLARTGRQDIFDKAMT